MDFEAVNLGQVDDLKGVGPEPELSRGSIRAAWKTASSAFLVSRSLVALFAYLGHLNRRPLFDPDAWDGAPNWWLNPWTTYDSIYYFVIAKAGYAQDPLTAAFFPLYPLLLKFGGGTENGMAFAGVLLSNVAFLLALYFLYRLTELDFGPFLAKKTIWLIALFPTSVFFSAVYTESIFLLLILASFYAARQNRWNVSGVCGLLAALTRNPGVLICAVLGVEYLRSIDYELPRIKIPPLLYVSLPLLGFAGVQLYLWYSTGIPMAGVVSQHLFYRAPGLPWEPIWLDLVGFFTYLDFDMVTFMNLLVIVMMGFLAIRFRRSLRPSYGIFMFGLIFMNLLYYVRIPPYTTSTARYVLVAFPFFQLLALVSEQGWLKRYVRPLAGVYLFTNFMFCFLFGIKSFLG